LSNGCPQFATDEKPVSASCHGLLLPYEEALLEYLVISKDFARVIFLQHKQIFENRDAKYNGQAVIWFSIWRHLEDLRNGKLWIVESFFQHAT
jgi:hypothetical protein